ncbi:CopG family transcriptional regulator [Cyanothece sp. BG0011]|uniref:plasmid mobilization protein n=1 Tax=Cyanothece sp. BG0011 TaxID=2082950 RepID=UPI000D1DF197|nr:CopG family transcriptional regulator [Cyanothece sp. BG0011]
MEQQEIRLRVPKDEYQTVKKEAKSRGLSVSDFFRILISKKQFPKKNSPREARELYLDLASLQAEVESMVTGGAKIDLTKVLEKIKTLRAACIGMEKVE